MLRGRSLHLSSVVYSKTPINIMSLTDQGFTIDDVRQAEQRIKGYATKTPVMTSHRMDAKAGRKVFFKCELFQRTGSFKFRGAVNFLSKLLEQSKEGPAPCVTTHSSGNFAQGLALASNLLGIKAYVVMPSIAPQCKQDAVKEYGAELILCTPTEQGRVAAKDKVVEEKGAVYAPSSQHHDIMAGQGTMFTEMFEQGRIAAKDKVVEEKGAVYAPTSQHHDIMAGQGTMFTEMFEQVDEKLDAIIAPVGGGGMLSGILVAAKTLQPGIKVIAAEPELANDCYQSFVAKKHIRQDHYPSTVADGLRISLGDVAWPIVRDLVDDVITVTEEEIKESTKLVWQCMKLCIEPSAGVGVAAVMSDKFKALSPDIKNVGVILCGGNIDIDSMKNWL